MFGIFSKNGSFTFLASKSNAFFGFSFSVFLFLHFQKKEKNEFLRIEAFVACATQGCVQSRTLRRKAPFGLVIVIELFFFVCSTVSTPLPFCNIKPASTPQSPAHWSQWKPQKSNIITCSKVQNQTWPIPRWPGTQVSRLLSPASFSELATQQWKRPKWVCALAIRQTALAIRQTNSFCTYFPIFKSRTTAFSLGIYPKNYNFLDVCGSFVYASPPLPSFPSPFFFLCLFSSPLPLLRSAPHSPGWCIFTALVLGPLRECRAKFQFGLDVLSGECGGVAWSLNVELIFVPVWVFASNIQLLKMSKVLRFSCGASTVLAYPATWSWKSYHITSSRVISLHLLSSRFLDFWMEEVPQIWRQER